MDRELIGKSGTKGFKIALAQISVIDGNVEYNLKKHCDVIEAIGKYNGKYVIFPELSLTGYELERSSQLAFSLEDERLIPIRDCCNKNNINAVIGAPIRLGREIVIGSLICFSDGTIKLYTKHFLHAGEEQYFKSGNMNPLIKENSEIFSFAICADTSSPIHRRTAYENKASVYITSALISTSGYANDTNVLRDMAKENKMTVLLANYCGETGGYKAAGESCAWNCKGELIGKLGAEREGILIVECTNTHEWLVDNIIAL